MSDRDAVQAGWDAYLAAPTHRDMGRSKVEAAIMAALKAAREQGGEAVVYISDRDLQRIETYGSTCAMLTTSPDNTYKRAIFTHPQPANVPEDLKLTADEQDAINHALDVLSKHGDAFTTVGAMTVLEKMLERATPPDGAE